MDIRICILKLNHRVSLIPLQHGVILFPKLLTGKELHRNEIKRVHATETLLKDDIGTKAFHYHDMLLNIL